MIAEQDIDFTGAPITWVDVARSLSALDPADKRWINRPAGLKWINVDWTGAEVAVDTRISSNRDVVAWLASVVRGLTLTSDGSRIILDGPPGLDRLDLMFVEDRDERPTRRINLGAVEGHISFKQSDLVRTPAREVPVIACHSVKGGTGRTICAVAIATLWAERAGKPILVVDADIEAPGLSYLYHAARPETHVAFEDVVALAHAGPSDGRDASLAWIAARLQGQILGTLMILPLRRSLDELASSSIRAEHLTSLASPYALADLLAAIAGAAGCAGVVIDLRAGLVPIAAQLMLDPTVPRVISTSLAEQSLRGTAALMRFIAREFRKLNQASTPPLLIVNRIPSIFREFGADDRILDPFLTEVEKSLFAADSTEIPADEPVLDDELALEPFFLLKVAEFGDLVVPQKRWDDFAIQLRTSGFLARLAEKLAEWFGAVLPDGAIAPPPPAALAAGGDASERRAKLGAFASRIEYAETNSNQVVTPLVTQPMLALAAESSQPPVVVIEGAKGTGKTLTARYLLSCATWGKALSDLTGAVPSFEAQFLPLLGSIQAGDAYQKQIDECRKSIAQSLGFAASIQLNVADIRARIRSKLQAGASDRDWADFWLDAMAWSVGVAPKHAGAGRSLLDLLRQKNMRLIATIEGIEEVYESMHEGGLPSMLRSLLIDLPLRLRAETPRNLGLIIFARGDTVDVGVAQNRAQFRQQYGQYALAWTEGDVLELAAWISTKSGALNLWTDDFRQLPMSEKERRLEPLWGKKLGRDELPGGGRVKEALTAGWVIAVLSDLKDRLTARDLVRFIKEAAIAPAPAREATHFGSRLLLPSALRAAVGPTSRAKVQDTIEEITELKAIFARFRQHGGMIRAPIQEEGIKLLQLGEPDIALLRLHGIILGDAPPYEVAELFRIGLGLRHGGARYSVVGMRRRARQRSGGILART